MARFLHRPEDFRVLHGPYSAALVEHYARHGEDLVRGHGYPCTLDEWQEQRARLRRRFVESLGLDLALVDAPPEARGDLRAVVAGTIDRTGDGYRIERIEFQSSPRVYVSASLYLPADLPPGRRVPAVYSPHGHWQTGKHTRHIQIRSANLARRGYAVLVVDTMGQSERTFMGHRDPAAHALLYAGASMPGLQVWDNLRALDYLCSRPEVDPARIGVTGASGGGNHTMYLAAVDERVAVAVPVCAVEMFDVYFRKSQCVCETVPDLLTYADKPHLLGLIAPRPLLIMNGLRDGGFPTLSARRAFDKTRGIYELYDGGDTRLALFETNVEHSYDRAMRERAYAWFDQWLYHLTPHAAAARSPEADTWVEAEEYDTLNVWGRDRRRPSDAHTVSTYYAQLTGEGGSAGTPHRTMGGSGERADARDGSPDSADALRRRIVGDAFGGWPERSPLNAETVDTIERIDCAVELLVYWSEAGIPVPSLLFRPTSAGEHPLPAVVFTSSAGKARAPELRVVHEIVRSGAVVLAIDYRGQGETAGAGQGEGEGPAVGRGIMLHRPLFAGRVWDVVRGAEYLGTRPEVDPAAIYVWGEGDAALLALHAAALDTSVAGAACLGLPDLYGLPAGAEVTLAPWLVVPGLLALADVSDLKALVAPRPCITGLPGTADVLVPSLWRNG